jgi:formylglycine-generating enzyme required for sulfatase activity
VGSLRPNDWGLFDMQGNVWQWCQDRWVDDDKGREQPPGGKEDLEDKVDDKTSRLLRGCPFYLSALYVRSANRVWNEPANRGFGFRPARTFH